MNILQAILSVISGIVILIPLMVELIKYIQSTIKEKNWSNLINMVLSLMSEAEFKFDTGEERKAFVMAELHSLSKTLNYDIDWEVISVMIDNLCEMAKNVNVNPS